MSHSHSLDVAHWHPINGTPEKKRVAIGCSVGATKPSSVAVAVSAMRIGSKTPHHPPPDLGRQLQAKELMRLRRVPLRPSI